MLTPRPPKHAVHARPADARARDARDTAPRRAARARVHMGRLRGRRGDGRRGRRVGRRAEPQAKYASFPFLPPALLSPTPTYLLIPPTPHRTPPSRLRLLREHPPPQVRPAPRARRRRSRRSSGRTHSARPLPKQRRQTRPPRRLRRSRHTAGALEAERLKEQVARGKGGKTSGGMVASVDAGGRLVWD